MIPEKFQKVIRNCPKCKKVGTLFFVRDRHSELPRWKCTSCDYVERV